MLEGRVLLFSKMRRDASWSKGAGTFVVVCVLDGLRRFVGKGKEEDKLIAYTLPRSRKRFIKDPGP